tara:strand:- start:74 stop:1612 length:1539 start_codon:yes stop_codon:yes gene_type:complete
MNSSSNQIYDLLIIGGGINGAGIARDAAGRGHSVCLCEMNDFASGTSSSSTKLIHGGLRYLENYQFRLVQKSLKEREVLLKMAPHIIKPMRFILPHSKKMRPAWLIRIGLAIYDHLGFRKILPGTSSVKFKSHTNNPLKEEFKYGFEYSDCWVDDSRLVILNLIDASNKGATVINYTKVTDVKNSNDFWSITTINTATGKEKILKARTVINAAGPWVDEVLNSSLNSNNTKNVRLVRGSHIVVNKLFDHDKSYICQNDDGRIFFIIPFEDNFTLIGTTDIDHGELVSNVQISHEEKKYICDSANKYLKNEINLEDIVWSYSGVRPLYDDGATKAQEATRDYIISSEKQGTLLMINIFGGKITTYRRLAENILELVEKFLGKEKTSWTENSSLPGGEMSFDGQSDLFRMLNEKYPFLSKQTLERLVRSYGLLSLNIFGDSEDLESLGVDFGSGLYEKEVKYLVNEEWALTSDDILFRRSKLGLILPEKGLKELNSYLDKYFQNAQISEKIAIT